MSGKLLPTSLTADKNAAVVVGVADEYITAAGFEANVIALLRRIIDLEERKAALQSAIAAYQGGGVQTLAISLIEHSLVSGTESVPEQYPGIVYRRSTNSYNDVSFFRAQPVEFKVTILTTDPPVTDVKYHFSFDGGNTYAISKTPYFNYTYTDDIPEFSVTVGCAVYVTALDGANGQPITSDILTFNIQFSGIDPSFDDEASIRAVTNLPILYNTVINVDVFRNDDNSLVGTYGVTLTDVSIISPTTISLPRESGYRAVYTQGINASPNPSYIYASSIIDDITTQNKIVEAGLATANFNTSSHGDERVRFDTRMDFIFKSDVITSRPFSAGYYDGTPFEPEKIYSYEGYSEIYRMVPNLPPILLAITPLTSFSSLSENTASVQNSNSSIYAMGIQLTIKELNSEGLLVNTNNKSFKSIIDYDKTTYNGASMKLVSSGTVDTLTVTNTYIDFLGNPGPVISNTENVKDTETLLGITLIDAGYSYINLRGQSLDVSLYAMNGNTPNYNDLRGKGRIYFTNDPASFRASNYIYINNPTVDDRYQLEIDAGYSHYNAAYFNVIGSEAMVFDASDIEGVITAPKGVSYVTKIANFYSQDTGF